MESAGGGANAILLNPNSGDRYRPRSGPSVGAPCPPNEHGEKTQLTLRLNLAYKFRPTISLTTPQGPRIVLVYFASDLTQSLSRKADSV
jgi:hypothetical protein